MHSCEDNNGLNFRVIVLKVLDQIHLPEDRDN